MGDGQSDRSFRREEDALYRAQAPTDQQPVVPPTSTSKPPSLVDQIATLRAIKRDKADAAKSAATTAVDDRLKALEQLRYDVLQMVQSLDNRMGFGVSNMSDGSLFGEVASIKYDGRHVGVVCVTANTVENTAPGDDAPQAALIQFKLTCKPDAMARVETHVQPDATAQSIEQFKSALALYLVENT